MCVCVLYNIYDISMHAYVHVYRKRVAASSVCVREHVREGEEGWLLDGDGTPAWWIAYILYIYIYIVFIHTNAHTYIYIDISNIVQYMYIMNIVQYTYIFIYILHQH